MKKVMGRLLYGGMKMRGGVEYGVMVVCVVMMNRNRGCVGMGLNEVIRVDDDVR